MEATEVRLSSVRIEAGSFHPFSGGLIVRRLGPKAWIAASGSLLRVERAWLADGRDAMGLLREGRRLHTPREKLEEAMDVPPDAHRQGIQEDPAVNNILDLVRRSYPFAYSVVGS